MVEQEIIYYQMLENVHVVFKEEQMNFWRGEIYEPREFSQSVLNLEELMKRGKCKLFEKSELEEPGEKG